MVEIDKTTSIETQDLKARAAQAKLTRVSKHYLVKHNNTEIAYVCLDSFPDDLYLVIYELFITSNKRRMGFGTQILLEIEGKAKRQGYSEISVRPHPLSEDITKDALILWYKSKSYVEDIEDPEILTKSPLI